MDKTCRFFRAIPDRRRPATGCAGVDSERKTLDNDYRGSNIKGIAPSHRLGSCWVRLSRKWNIGQDDVPSKEFSMSSQPRRRRLEVEHIGDVTVVNFVDRKILDEQNIQIIGDQLFGLVDTEGLRKLLLNFGNVEYLSSAALGKL